MGAARKDHTISKDIDFTYSFTVNNYDDTPFNLSGYTAIAKIRPAFDSRIVLATFICEIESTSGGPITISLTADDTADLPLGIFHWDLAITNPSAPDLKLLKGKATIEATAAL